MLNKKLFVPLGILLFCAACGSDPKPEPAEPADPPEVTVGERLFLETRFAQYFNWYNGNRVNDPLAAGDPILDFSQTTGAPLPGPFAGQSMNCRSCHLVDEEGDFRAGGVRTYADFARRSPIPLRDDGRITTPRNSPPLVNATLPRTPFLLHFDGEFDSLLTLIEDTVLGRNFGWLPDERAIALAHFATVIRYDDGLGALAADFGALPYSVVLKGTDPAIPPAYLLPPQFRIDVQTATDQEVLAAASNLIGAYVESLIFTQNLKTGDFIASPYDKFLRKNNLPAQPDAEESDLEYSRRLRGMIDNLREPKYVTVSDGSFTLHAQSFIFGKRELQGLRTFLAEPEAPPPTGGVGNCVACHPAPLFTDFSLHNTGASQDEYDAIHGPGAFAAIDIPGLVERNANPDLFLPPSAAHPDALGIFFDVPAANSPDRTDLGVWNILGNPSVPAPQSGIEQILCADNGIPPAECNAEVLLPLSIALFKTPGLRDLGQSNPFLHTGQKNTVLDVLTFYIDTSALARAGDLRNADPEIGRIEITTADSVPLNAFIQALNEDYE